MLYPMKCDLHENYWNEDRVNSQAKAGQVGYNLHLPWTWIFGYIPQVLVYLTLMPVEYTSYIPNHHTLRENAACAV